MRDGVGLLKAAKNLDEEALTAIFDQFAPAIYKYTLRLCHDPIVADNIVGDVFAQLLEQFELGDSFKGKEDLFLSLYEERIERRRGELRSAVERAGGGQAGGEQAHYRGHIQGNQEVEPGKLQLQVEIGSLDQARKGKCQQDRGCENADVIGIGQVFAFIHTWIVPVPGGDAKPVGMVESAGYVRAEARNPPSSSWRDRFP